MAEEYKVNRHTNPWYHATDYSSLMGARSNGDWGDVIRHFYFAISIPFATVVKGHPPSFKERLIKTYFVTEHVIF